MRKYTNWKLAMIMLVAFCLVVTQIEPVAFAKGQQSNTSVPAATGSQSAAPPVAPQSSPDQTKPKSGHRRLKWLLIGVAVVGGVAAAVLIKNRSKTEPVVTVGGPTVGSPQ